MSDLVCKLCGWPEHKHGDRHIGGWHDFEPGGTAKPHASLADVLFDPPRLPGQYFDPEVVICAAVRAANGAIIRCHRHHDGLRALDHRRLFVALEDDDDQGFVTSRNRYVTREEGLRLQRAAGIPSVAPGGYRGTQLFPEDLY